MVPPPAISASAGDNEKNSTKRWRSAPGAKAAVEAAGGQGGLRAGEEAVVGCLGRRADRAGIGGGLGLLLRGGPGRGGRLRLGGGLGPGRRSLGGGRLVAAQSDRARHALHHAEFVISGGEQIAEQAGRAVRLR